jgi:hypothetical protein
MQALALCQWYRMPEAPVAAYYDCFAVLTALCGMGMPLVLGLRRQAAESVGVIQLVRLLRKEYAS